MTAAPSFEAERLLSPDSRPSSDSVRGGSLNLDKGDMHGTRLGAVRAYWLGTVVCMAGFLFGYDSGIIGMLKLANAAH